MTVSKEFLTFKNRLRHFDDDIEMVDIFMYYHKKKPSRKWSG